MNKKINKRLNDTMHVDERLVSVDNTSEECLINASKDSNPPGYLSSAKGILGGHRNMWRPHEVANNYYLHHLHYLHYLHCLQYLHYLHYLHCLKYLHYLHYLHCLKYLHYLHCLQYLHYLYCLHYIYIICIIIFIYSMGRSNVTYPKKKKHYKRKRKIICH